MSSSIIILFLASLLYVSAAIAQHPDKKKIDSLEQLLPAANGTQRIDYLNAIGQEYWWPSMTAADTIYYWAHLAYKESVAINYTLGKANALMLLGVAANFKKQFANAETDLRTALNIFEALHKDSGIGWCSVWLGQALYSQDKFDDALAYQKKSALLMDKTGDWEGQGKAWAWTGMTYATLGNYDSSFYYSSKSLQLREAMSDHLCVILSYINMGQLYKAAGSYRDALDYYHQGVNYAAAKHISTATLNWTYFDVVGTVYRLLNQPDSSSYFLEQSIHVDSTNEMTRVSYGETLLMKNQYDAALQIFLKPVEGFRKGNDNWDLMRVLMDAAKAYMKKEEYKTALSYALETSAIANKSGARQFMLEDWLILSKLYNNLGVYDSAYFFLQRFTALKDSIVNNQFLWKLSNYKKQEDFRNKTEQLALLDKENRIKEAKLKEDALLTWILAACVLIAAVTGFVIYKNLTLKRKNEVLANRGKQAELQQHLVELEMQSLRAQMNPHFIFNCLSSINSFILKNENDAASTYLTKFSRLVRRVLTQSKKSFISIEEELEMLTLYLDMEKLRFKDAFDYRIHFINAFDTGCVFVPPLLLQPFAENAIWHGLMHKNGFRHLDIELEQANKVLTCTITDNGIGRSRAAAIKSKSTEKRKSMGLQITAERLSLLNRNGNEKTFFRIEDLTGENGNPAGTKVVLKIHYRELNEINEEM